MLDRTNDNVARRAVEAALVAGGLTQVAGGTRHRYFGLPGQGVDGYSVRTGIRAVRLVNRIRLGNGLTDLTIGKERYYGKLPAEKVTEWAQRLVATEFGAKNALVRPAREVQIQPQEVSSD